MAQRVSWVTGECDATLWYLNGTYIGHDDQVDIGDFLGAEGEIVTVELEKLLVDPEWLVERLDDTPYEDILEVTREYLGR